MGLGWQELLTIVIFCLVMIVPIAVIVVAVLISKSKRATIQCPQCAETIKRQAKVCRFCGYILQVDSARNKLSQ